MEGERRARGQGQGQGDNENEGDGDDLFLEACVAHWESKLLYSIIGLGQCNLKPYLRLIAQLSVFVLLE